ncbi:MAG: hypothetical protein JKY56_17475 [Kofleriaceae bacterium]|nr:hypothetical protein [Kofleriaceae bacterium]
MSADCIPGQLWCQAQAFGEAGLLFAEFLTKELGRTQVQSELRRTSPATPEEGTQRRVFPRSQGAHSRLRQAPIRSLSHPHPGNSTRTQPGPNPTIPIPKNVKQDSNSSRTASIESACAFGYISCFVKVQPPGE